MTTWEWTFGAHLNGVEDIRGGAGVLGSSYGDGIDTRYDDTCMSPAVTAVDLSGSDAAGGGSVGTAATVRSAAFTNSINSPEKIIWARGTKLGATRLDTRASLFDGSAESGVPYGENVWSLYYEKSADGTEGVAVCFLDTIYRVITDVPETGGYTASANNESYKIAIMGRGGSDGAAAVVAGIGKGSGSTYKVFSNTLSGSTTLDASSWQKRADLPGDLVPTGFALDGRFWTCAFNDGAYFVDSDGQRYRPLQDELPTDPNNNQGFGTQQVSFLNGLLNPTLDGLRLQSGLSSRSVGIDLFDFNTAPIGSRYGHCTASAKWIYMPIYNPITSKSHIMALRPRQPSDQHDQPFSWYTLHEFSAMESKIALYSGFKGGVTSPTVWVGRGSNVGWFLEPLGVKRPWDDTNMTFTTSGTLYGTLLRRNPDRLKTPQQVIVETAGCSATNKIAIDLVMTDHRGDEKTVRCGGEIISNGRHVLPVPAGQPVTAFYPKVTKTGAGSNAGPRIRWKRLAVVGVER